MQEFSPHLLVIGGLLLLPRHLCSKGCVSQGCNTAETPELAGGCCTHPLQFGNATGVLPTKGGDRDRRAEATERVLGPEAHLMLAAEQLCPSQTLPKCCS